MSVLSAGSVAAGVSVVGSVLVSRAVVVVVVVVAVVVVVVVVVDDSVLVVVRVVVSIGASVDIVVISVSRVGPETSVSSTRSVMKLGRQAESRGTISKTTTSTRAACLFVLRLLE